MIPEKISKIFLTLLSSSHILPLPEIQQLFERINCEILSDFLSKNVILIRAAEQLQKFGISLPPSIKERVIFEKRRVSEAVLLIQKLGDLCGQLDIPFVMTKAFQHFPDMGHDIDLFVQDHSDRIDHGIKQLGGLPSSGSLTNRISGKSSYILPGFSTPVEIHHGRMGHIGEHYIFARLMASRSEKKLVSGIETFVPSREDQVILQVIQRLYGHFYFRLADIVNGWDLVKDPSLNWGIIQETARRIGIQKGLSIYLQYLSRMNQEGTNTLVTSKLKFDGLYYYIPFPGIPLKIFRSKFFEDLKHGNCDSCLRLSLLPAISLWFFLQKMGRICLRYATEH